MNLRLPINPGLEVTMTVPRKMTEREWARMMLILRRMKPGLVLDGTDSNRTPSPGSVG